MKVSFRHGDGAFAYMGESTIDIKSPREDVIRVSRTGFEERKPTNPLSIYISALGKLPLMDYIPCD